MRGYFDSSLDLRPELSILLLLLHTVHGSDLVLKLEARLFARHAIRDSVKRKNPSAEKMTVPDHIVRGAQWNPKQSPRLACQSKNNYC